MRHIIFTVTNELAYDQRMQRICTSLSAQQFRVTLIGRALKNSPALLTENFKQKRVYCIFNKGFFFYGEYNFRLFFWLLFKKADIFCAIDLDTILPVYLASAIKRKKRVYDAHELFTEQKEILTRSLIHKIWLLIEKFAVPKFKDGYTVSHFIANELKRRYKVNYEVIRNLPHYYSFSASAPEERMDKFLIYQGAVNEGRSFETLIPAMQNVNSKLRIYGSGNFIEQTKNLIIANNVQNKVELMGYVLPEKLKEITTDSYIGLMLFEKTGLNQYYSLSNRFFDYIMAAIPQLCVNYPEYKTVNDKFNIAYMIEDTNAETITQALNKLLNNAKLYQQLHQNCLKAREELNWEKEQNKLIKFYEEIATSIIHYRVIKIRKKNFK